MPCCTRDGWCGRVPECPRCKLAARGPEFAAVIDRQTHPEDFPEVGVGDHLKQLLAELGLRPRPTCRCNARRRQMNRWGNAGCAARRAEIEGWLREEAEQVGWVAKLKAGVAAAAGGLILNPLDPAPGLLDEAIRRASA